MESGLPGIGIFSFIGLFIGWILVKVVSSAFRGDSFDASSPTNLDDLVDPPPKNQNSSDED